MAHEPSDPVDPADPIDEPESTPEPEPGLDSFPGRTILAFPPPPADQSPDSGHPRPTWLWHGVIRCNCGSLVFDCGHEAHRRLASAIPDACIDCTIRRFMLGLPRRLVC